MRGDTNKLRTLLHRRFQPKLYRRLFHLQQIKLAVVDVVVLAARAVTSPWSYCLETV
jgi:hypothetical protein